MSTSIVNEEYFEELVVCIILGTLLLCTKLYVCCITGGALNQARDISTRSDTLSQVRSTAPAPNYRLQRAQPGPITNIREARCVQLTEGNQVLPLAIMHDIASQTYSFPQKFTVVNLWEVDEQAWWLGRNPTPPSLGTYQEATLAIVASKHMRGVFKITLYHS